MYVVRGNVQAEVAVSVAQQSRGRLNLSMVRPPTHTASFVCTVLFLRVKNVATKHGLGNFSEQVLSHDITWAWERIGSNHRMVFGSVSNQNGLAGTSRAKKQFFTPILKESKRRTKHLRAYFVSYVSKVSVGRVSARRDCRSRSRQLLQCCVLRARGDVLAVGAKRASLT